MGSVASARSALMWAREALEKRQWDDLERHLGRATSQLDGLAAQESAPLLAEIEAIRAAVAPAQRAEKAEKVAREVKRALGNLEDEIARRGSQVEMYAQKAADRLAQADVRELLEPDAQAKAQAQLAELQAKAGIGQPPPPRAAPAMEPRASGAAAPRAQAAAPAPSAPSAPTAAGAKTAPSAPSAAPQASPVPARDNEQARLIENEINRLLNFADGEVGSNPGNAVSYVERAKNRLSADQAREQLDAAVAARLRDRVASLEGQIAAGQRAEKVKRLEEQIGRFVRQADEDASWNAQQAERMIEHAVEKLGSSEAKELLPAASADRFHAELARVRAKLAGKGKSDALERARPIVEELEELASGALFEGQDESDARRLQVEIDALKQRARAALEPVPADDADAREFAGRITAVEERVAASSAAWVQDRAAERVSRAWESLRDETYGWEDESESEGEEILPKTFQALGRLRYFLGDADLQQIRGEHAGDERVAEIFASAERAAGEAADKLHAAFGAIVSGYEDNPRPKDRFDFERALRVAHSAGRIFEGTRHLDENVARAKALDERWQGEIAAEEAARKALYEKLSAEASEAWPGILASIRADDGFDPHDETARGRAFRLSGVINRAGWDFDGNQYEFAIWVNGTPLAGNFAPNVRQTFEEMGRRAGFIDDHAPWDAVVVVTGPGKVKQRTTTTVRSAETHRELGKLEEWLPIDCVQCKVIALRAGPVAIGPAEK